MINRLKKHIAVYLGLLYTIVAVIASECVAAMHALQGEVGHLQTAVVFSIFFVVLVIGYLTSFLTRRKGLNEASLLQGIIASAAEGVVLVSAANSKIIYTNRRFDEMFGYGAEELAGQHISTVNAPTDSSPEETASKINRSLEEGGVWNGEIRSQKKDGSVFWTLAHISRFHDQEYGAVWVSFQFDITDRKQTEEKLRQAKQLTDSIVNNTPAMIFLKRASDLRFELINYAAEELMGYPASTMLGKTDYDLFPKDQADFFTARDREVLASHEIIEIPEEQITTSGGESRYLYTRKVALRDEAGHPLYLLGISIDISERKYFVRHLQRWQDIFRHAEWGVVIGSADGSTIELMNPAFAKMHGYTVEELTGQPIISVFAPEARDELPDFLQRAHEQGHHTFESMHLRKDGSQFPVLIDITVVYGDQGEVLYRVVNVQDITERKLVELEQRRLAEMQAAILDSLPANIALIDSQGTILAVNRSWERFAKEHGGISQSVGVGSNYLATCDDVTGRDKQDAAAIAAGLRSVIWGGCIRYSREYACPSNGQQKWYRMVAVPFKAEARTGAVVMHMDVTESRLAEEQLHVREEEFRALVENSPDIIIRFDRECRYLYANPAIEAISTIPAKGFIGKTLGSLGMSEAMEMACRDAIRMTIEHGAGNVVEFSYKMPQGERHFHARVVPEFNKRGVVETVLAVVRDITESKVIELELSSSRQLLRELAAENEAAREEERKYVAREVHDELGQILTALRMDAALLRIRFGTGEPALTQKIQDMMALVDRAIQGVRDVAARLRPAVLDMGVISAIEWLCDEFSRHTGVPCDLHVSEEGVELDEARKIVIFRIVQESLTNVARYAAADRVDVFIGRRGSDLCVEVSDDGKGFDPEAHTTGKSFGLLGMRERAIVLGGDVDIISSPGRGTTVSVLIPLMTVNVK